MKIRIALTGRSYDMAADLPEELELADDATVNTAIEKLSGLLPQGRSLPASCLVSVGGAHLGTVTQFEDRPLEDGQELMLIAPVAGG